MDISPKSCRICLSESEFNTSLFGNYCRKNNMVVKILVCLKIAIEETDVLSTICYKCAENVENYYNFTMQVKKSQAKLVEPRRNVENCRVTSYVREQVYDADYTFSFLEIPKNEEKQESKCSSPFFSYFSPPNVLMKQSTDHAWKTPRPRKEIGTRDIKKQKQRMEGSRHHSRDLFESQSQDVEDIEPKTLDWNLTPDDNIIKRVRDKCFGRSDF